MNAARSAKHDAIRVRIRDLCMCDAHACAGRHATASISISLTAHNPHVHLGDEAGFLYFQDLLHHPYAFMHKSGVCDYVSHVARPSTIAR